MAGLHQLRIDAAVTVPADGYPFAALGGSAPAIGSSNN